MPELVKKLEDQLQSFSSQVDDLQDDLHKLVHVPKKTVAVKETPYLPLKNSFHRARRDYIASSIISTSDGGYAVVGCTITYSLDENDFFLVKTDAYGNMEWKQKYGTGNKGGSCMVSATDGGYLLAGITSPDEMHASDLFLVKVDEYGSMEWNQTIGGPGIHRPSFIIKTCDNKYVIAGEKSISDIESDIWLIKIDEHGKTLQPESEP